MSWIGGIWDSLLFNAGDAAKGMISRYTIRVNKHANDGPLVYRNNRAYESVVVHVTKRLAVQTVENALKQALPKFMRNTELKMKKFVVAQQSKNYQTLIDNRESQMEKYGRVNADGGHVIIAKDKYGNPVPEALMLYYNDTDTHDVEDTVTTNGTTTSVQYSTKTVCHIDLSPEVTMNSSKNIVLTQVQGRDYTRKELVSGGDLMFSVSGSIVSDEDGIYPADKVKKFVQIMQYNGIVDVNYIMMGQLNVKHVIIREFSLGRQEYKNVQPYSFSCVAVEPDEEVKVTKDTISVVNTQLAMSDLDEWYKLVLDLKKLNRLSRDTATVSDVATDLGDIIKTI